MLKMCFVENYIKNSRLYEREFKNSFYLLNVLLQRIGGYVKFHVGPQGNSTGN
ncbi:hypothetical protein AHMF7616_00248 [Adhaeribacter pallidiroseus]|uniref:Uncharacterized protein n=1 Tax=Adhaeribacter pallidiroseus TaxID=2072847 RepID=A0A369QHA7_9BACT|nr:hypothetical protein AHMF7616_00248 [Adhaeribacter pallidiroseus]